MHFSGSNKSSNHCLPSPDGKLVATLFPKTITIRAVETLDVINVIELPQDFSGPVLRLLWSPCSNYILVATVDQIRVFSAAEKTFGVTIQAPVPPATKPTYICFSPSSTDLCVSSSLGLKLSIFSLKSSKVVEISNPKFFNAATARNGLAFRPLTRHLALMTRTDGKDTISIHEATSWETQRSWHPETVDAQGLLWSPDGKWLVVWESGAQGHKALFYTADGHLFKTWCGPSNPLPEDKHFRLGAGIKLAQFSKDSKHLAMGDSSRSITIFNMASVSESLRLRHPSTIVPTDTIQIWQEQVNVSQAGPSLHTFLKAIHAISPPARTTTTATTSDAARTGASTIAFDASSVLLATTLEDAPTTLWIWDTQAAELRAVLVFYSPIAAAAWHPTTRETLLVRCEGELYAGMAFVWDPLSEGPRTVDFAAHLPAPGAGPRTAAVSWIGGAGAEDDDGAAGTTAPLLFCSDGSWYVLAALDDQAEPRWSSSDAGAAEWDARAGREESPLVLVPAGEADDDGEGQSDVEDTFHFKR